MTVIVKEMIRLFGSETKKKNPKSLITKRDQNETLRFVCVQLMTSLPARNPPE